jgi:hypothetical protein
MVVIILVMSIAEHLAVIPMIYRALQMAEDPMDLFTV